MGVAGLDASSPGRSVFHRSPRSSLTKPILAVGAEWDREQPLGRQSGRLLPTPLAVPAPLPSAAHSEVSHCSFGPYGRPGVNISSAMKPAVHMMSVPIHSGLGWREKPRSIPEHDCIGQASQSAQCIKGTFPRDSPFLPLCRGQPHPHWILLQSSGVA